MSHEVIADRAKRIKEEIEAIHAETYKVVEWCDGDSTFFIIASYSLEKCEYEIAVTTESFVEIKLLAELPKGIFKAVADVYENVLNLPPAGEVTPLSVADIAERAERTYKEPKDVESFGVK